MDTTPMQDDKGPDQGEGDLFREVYRHPEAGRGMARVGLRGEQLLALAAGLDEAVCEEKPADLLREYISAVEYIAEDLRTTAMRCGLTKSLKL